MDLERKIGQLIVAGFEGTEVNESIREMITKYHVGNIILFEHNCKTPEQIFKLTQDLQKIALESNGVPLFITIDQENGTVTRIYDGVTVFPGNMAQSAGATVEETKQVGYFTGIGLKALGINFNLAPSVDINNNPNNPVIGVRSFGETRRQVSERGNAFICGLQETGVIATAKHFPGHGDTCVDSHLDLPIVPHAKERLEQIELYPFKKAIEKGVKAIMSAHIQFPGYEPTGLPATLSYQVLTKLLREELGFEGLIITDCMEMKAIDTHYGTAQAVPMAIGAGADLVCLSHTKQKQIDAIEEIYKALEKGVLTEERINQSVNRILKEKENYHAEDFLKISYEDTKKDLYQKEHENLAKKISEKSITLIKNDGSIPITAQDILIIAPQGRVLTGADGTRVAPNFANFFAERIKDRHVETYEIDNMPTEKQMLELEEKCKYRELIIFCTHNGGLAPKQIELAKRLLAINKRFILIPMRNPYDSQLLIEVGCCVLPYEYTVHSMTSLIKVLMGNIRAEGKLPVRLNLRY